VPIGTTPWRGPPVPYDTPITNGLNITPHNKFPNIPPGADYDPGPPVVQLPPGVPQGPGPAPNAPFPLPVPPDSPNDPRPAPLPYYAPPDMILPPYSRTPPDLPGPPAPPSQLPAEAPPQASAPATTTYDSRTGVFVDPAGGTGVLAAGRNDTLPAEKWVDLMLDPRKA
jgi:phospholipid/cholesterol/gamma-HCH transport system substrate-binding protein